MHELSITNDIVTTVLETAKKHGANRVVTVFLRIGAMRDLVPDWMQRYFDYCSKGTAAEGARLQIESIPVTLACQHCGLVFKADVRSPGDIRCQRCGALEAKVKTGMELRIERIQVQ